MSVITGSRRRRSALQFLVGVALGTSLAACDPGGGGGGGGAFPLDGHTLGTLGDTHATTHGLDTTAASSCIRGADLDVLQLHILATSGVCGVLCAQDSARSTCAAACVQSRNSYIGPTCSRCFGDLALCAADHCLAACATAPSEACVTCGAANCAIEFERCYDAASVLPTDVGPASDTTDDTEPGLGDDSFSPDHTGDSGPGDCDDGDPLRSPGATETCDLIDNDCDGRTDEGCWAELGVGTHHTCAIREADRGVVCWGWDVDGQATAPAGSFLAVTAGRNHSCASRTSGGITCWGEGALNDDRPAFGLYPQLTASTSDYSCGVREDHVARCWGGSQADDLPTGAFLSLGAGEWHACGVDSGGWLTCWGSETDGELAAPSGTFTKVSCGSARSCALGDDQAIRCWGTGLGDPAGTFRDVAVGYDGACAIRTDGTLYCWGPGADLSYGEPPGGGNWVRIGAGHAHACALGEDGAIACWGDNVFAQLGPL